MRLIDADKVTLEMQREYCEGCDTDDTCAVCWVRDYIEYLKKTPTVEAEPIIHAHWVTMSDNCGTFYCCSNCGEDLPRHFIKKPSYTDLYGELISIDKTPRCPYCGAEMNR